MSLKMQWLASTDPDDKSGLISFEIGGQDISLDLLDFETAHKLDRFIRYAIDLTQQEAKQVVIQHTKRLLTNYERDRGL